MLAAVEFDDEPRTKAGEVDDVALDRRLPAKMVALALQRAQVLPQADLVWRHRLAQSPGRLVGHRGGAPTHHAFRVVPPPRCSRGGGMVRVARLRLTRCAARGRGRRHESKPAVGAGRCHWLPPSPTKRGGWLGRRPSRVGRAYGRESIDAEYSFGRAIRILGTVREVHHKVKVVVGLTHPSKTS